MVTAGTLRIQIRLLGLVEVSLDGRPVALGGSKQRALLALLALNVNAPVSTDQLIEGLWGEFAPPSAVKMVQLYVSQVRRLLDGGDGVIVTRGRGYELRLPADAVDAVRFERLVAEASGADERASALAGEALALWGGRPLDDIADQPFAGPEIRRLDEQWLDARELAIDGALAAGDHRKVLASSTSSSPRTHCARGSTPSECSPCTGPDARPTRSRPTATPAACWCGRLASSLVPSCAVFTRRS